MSILDRWAKRKVFQQTFFVSWKDEYLTSLSKTKTRRDNKDIKVGALVLLLNERQTRHDYPLARVQQVFRSKDTVYRSVKLLLPLDVTTKKTKRGSKVTKSDDKRLYIPNKPRFTTRGVENICVLEDTPSVEHQLQNEDEDERVPNTSLDSDELDQDRANYCNSN